MQKLFVCLLAVLWCEYAYGYEERFVKNLIKVHSDARKSFKYQGNKLPPLKYSRKLMNLAREWVNTCRESRPTDGRFANLGSSVITAALYLPLVSQWKSQLSIEAKAYNPATGQCINSPCEHYRQIVQPNITEFGCAFKRCYFSPPGLLISHLSVCLYYAEQKGPPIQLTTTTTTAATRRPTTTITTTTTKAPITAFTTPKTSTISKLPSADNDTVMEEVKDDENLEGEEKEEEEKEEEKEEEEEEEEEEEGDGEDKAEGTSDLAILSPHLLPFMLAAMILLS
ncbi:unnamed protein product [Taenia asiatica]|uniref:SCP domain-containing protein n=1 Tax=Taenia asiatica TaxID=60517 RepID=A0A0R3W5E0_TAEAS|nr:unnamed protein product [Taenia asiatica]